MNLGINCKKPERGQMLTDRNLCMQDSKEYSPKSSRFNVIMDIYLSRRVSTPTLVPYTVISASKATFYQCPFSSDVIIIVIMTYAPIATY
jgi:hypothetical protein